MISLTQAIEKILQDRWENYKPVKRISLPKEMVNKLQEEIGFIKTSKKIKTFDAFNSDYGLIEIKKSNKVVFQ